MEEWRSGTVIANGLRVQYYRTGGERSPLVLAHGITDNGLCWTRVARVLASDYDVIMYDARGHGLSEAPSKRWSITDLADDLASFVRLLNLEKPVLMGHSMGAATVALAAAEHPYLARALVLEDPPWREIMPRDEEQQEGAGHRLAWMERIKGKTRDELIVACREQSPTWSQEELGPWADSKIQVSPLAMQTFARSGPTWQDTATRIECPVLLLRADPDKGAIVTSATATKAARMLRNGCVVHIPGAGHSIRREQFNAYIEAVRAFLDEI